MSLSRAYVLGSTLSREGRPCKILLQDAKLYTYVAVLGSICRRRYLPSFFVELLKRRLGQMLKKEKMEKHHAAVLHFYEYIMYLWILFRVGCVVFNSVARFFGCNC